MDNGPWQNKNVFKDVTPGKHTFHARNKKNHDKENTKVYTLDKPYGYEEIDARTHKGEQGTRGATGTQGTNGSQGTVSVQGTNGIQGTQGVSGTQGTQGHVSSSKSKESIGSNKPLNKSDINRLLDRVSRENEDAYDILQRTLGNNTKVIGVANINNVYDLTVDAFAGTKYTVTEINRDGKGNIVSIEVKKN
jgi:hypothetical protein